MVSFDINKALEASQPQSPLDAERVKDAQADRDLRKRWATMWFILIAAQLGLMNLLFIATGLGWLVYSEWLFHAYLVGTLGEAFGIVLVIARYLFPKRDSR